MSSTTETSVPTTPLSIVPISREAVQVSLRSLAELLKGDENEQRETFEYLKRVLDEDRPSERRLFA
jgi:hypothetical protein